LNILPLYDKVKAEIIFLRKEKNKRKINKDIKEEKEMLTHTGTGIVLKNEYER